ncbi:MAG: glycosyltransferase [Lachnospiraceae bacterium]|nr:glycosyltransferase [Lachnospiraceae bacterium]
MTHTILICRYQSICEPDVIAGFEKNGYRVEEFTKEIQDPDYDVDYLQQLAEVILANHYDFIFSMNFFPIISKLCNALRLPYVCWQVDAPFFLLNAPEISGEYNCIFLFDRKLYQQYRHKNPQGIYHLPLAANTERLQNTVLNCLPEKKLRCGKEIAFIGSLYTEKSVFNRIRQMPQKLKKELEILIEKQLAQGQQDLLAELLTPELINDFFQVVSLDAMPEGYQVDKRLFLADEYLAVKVTELERIRLLNRLAEEFAVSVYTQSDISPLHNIRFCGSADSLYEMPHIFKYSKINLNPTAKGIHTGISQRVWDVLGAGGFLICNAQPEVLETFEAGKDLEVYYSLEELADKCRYYLRYEKERRRIAVQGLQKVQKYHTYEKRIGQMLQIIEKR